MAQREEKGKRHRLMVIQLAQDMSMREAVQIARVYDLPGGVIDSIERSHSGMALIQALEQRLIICEGDAGIMTKFCQTLYDIRLDRLARKVKEAYPDIDAKQNNPQQPVGRTERGMPVGPPNSMVHSGGGGDVPMDYVSTDVSDAILTELSACIGAEWKMIARGQLGLKQYNIDHIEEENKKLRDKVTAAFIMWRRKNAGEATAAVLKRLLEENEDVDEDAIKVLEKYTNGH